MERIHQFFNLMPEFSLPAVGGQNMQTDKIEGMFSIPNPPEFCFHVLIFDRKFSIIFGRSNIQKSNSRHERRQNACLQIFGAGKC